MAARTYFAAESLMTHSPRPMPSRAVRRLGDAPPDELAMNSHSRALSAKNPRGEMRLFLQRVVGGLYVEREDIPRSGLQSLQSIQFVDADRFHEWCDNDSVRFEHPLLHVELKRQGNELWDLEPAPCIRGP